MIWGIATDEEFIYEIMWLCLIITLTSLDELRKIRFEANYESLTPSFQLSVFQFTPTV